MKYPRALSTHHFGIALAGGILLGGLAACPGNKPGTGASDPCTSAETCDAAPTTAGRLCIDGSCSPCQSTHECQGTPFYGIGSTCSAEGRCVRPAACTAGTLACPCNDGGTCDSGLVCDGDSQLCREPRACAPELCAAHQACSQPNPAADATCLAACESGFEWNPSTSACDAVSAACLAAGCSALYRKCLDGGATATCGGCISGYVDVGGTCEVQVTCAQLSCAADNRDCIATPNGHCGGCKVGFLDEAGACRPVLSCDFLNCPQYCQLEGEHTDAACFTDCTVGFALNPITHQCDDCTGTWPCNREGETGELEPLKTKTLHCACKTQPGYFFWDTNNGGTTNCDQDSDGWLRAAARIAVENVENDPVISNTMNCAVPRIDRVVLETRPEGEGGSVATAQTAEVLLGDTALQLGISSLVLYEDDRLDDPAKLPLLSLPKYGGDPGRKLEAQELNGLTKYCVDALADFNQDGKSDFSQWDLGLSGDESAEQRAYLLFAHFGELYRSWIEPGSFGAPGKLHVREKLRDATAPDGDRVAPTYDASDGSYWQRCKRFRDAEFKSDENAVTMDFARGIFRPGELFPGLNHHSQFKCVRIVRDPDPGHSPPVKLPQVYDSDLYYSGGPASLPYQLNTCVANPGSAPPVVAPGASANGPYDPNISCQAVAPVEQIGWVSVRYKGYPTSDSCPEPNCTNQYARGCVSECQVIYELPQPYWCPGMSGPGVPSPGVYCESDANDSGKRFCGCGYQFAGAGCEIGCPGSEFHRSPDFDLKTRTGFWLCGGVTASDGATLAGGVYTLRGRVPAPAIDRPALTGGGFVLK